MIKGGGYGVLFDILLGIVGGIRGIEAAICYFGPLVYEEADWATGRSGQDDDMCEVVGRSVYLPGVEQPNAGIHALWRGIALR